MEVKLLTVVFMVILLQVAIRLHSAMLKDSGMVLIWCAKVNQICLQINKNRYCFRQHYKAAMQSSVRDSFMWGCGLQSFLGDEVQSQNSHILSSFFYLCC